MKEYKLFFICGDRSADNYLSILLKNIKQISPQTKTIVVSGEKSKSFADKFVVDLVSYDAHGFFSPFTKFIKFVNLAKKIKYTIKEEQPSLVVLMDYYGFNIRVAKIAKKLGVKTIYYITPQVWASRKYRIKKIKKYVDFVINIYPFEPQLFSSYGIKSFYFGHPITDIIKDIRTYQKTNIIGVFPGSRKQVIKWNLPVMLKIVQNFIKNYSEQYKFVIFGFEKYKKVYENIVKDNVEESYQKYIQMNTQKDNLRKEICFAVSVSGTVVLENIFYNIPTVVVYNLPTLMYLLLKKIVYVKYISLPNLLLNEDVVPEFIKNKIDIEKICSYIIDILTNNYKLEELLYKYQKIKVLLSHNKDVSLSVAKKIVEYLYEQN
jgi:lipid-A-disaccharide synthase